MSNLNESEILTMIRDAIAPRNSDGFTRQELQEVMGCGKCKALNAIKRLIKDGDVEATMLDRANIHGQQNKVKGYVLTEKS